MKDSRCYPGDVQNCSIINSFDDDSDNEYDCNDDDDSFCLYLVFAK